jgi:thiol:disulfide interchange protein DsbA
MFRRLTLSTTLLLALSAMLLFALHACGSRQAQTPAPAAAPASTAAAAVPSSAAGSTADATDDTSQSANGTAQSNAPVTPAASTPSPSLEQLAALPANAALPESSKWKPNVNYTVVSPSQPTSAPPGKVEVLEVMWLGCPHCYAFEPYIDHWLKTKPDYIDFVRVPVMWDPLHRAHARLFYTLEALGRNDLIDKAFASMHQLEDETGSEAVLYSAGDKHETLKLQEAWAEQHGISAAAFAQAYNSFYVNTKLQHAQEITDAYEVQGVPFIAVAGKYATDVGKAGGENQLISLIDFLAGWVHEQQQKESTG